MCTILYLQYHDLLALREISAILGESDVSPFEILHSGLVGRLVNYLSDNTSFDRDQHIRNFLFVFINCPVRIYYMYFY